MIIRSLPSSGKTTLTNKRPDTFVDIDELIEEVTGLKAGPETSEKIERSQMLLDKLKIAIEAIESEGKVLLTNINTHHITGKPVDYQLLYPGDKYVEHIKQSGRTDLIEMFDESTLTEWATPTQDKMVKIINMDPGTYLESYINDIM